MKIHYKFLLFAIIATQISFTANAGIQDSLILVEFYNNMHGENWKNNTNWLVNPLSTWYGVSSWDPSAVRELNLNDNNLEGFLNKSLGDLNLLDKLNLHYNYITGSIPPELGKLSLLSDLGLAFNDLTGEIPPELGNLSSLTQLDLSYNGLTGELPAELGKLYQLVGLDLSHNNLSGTVPSEWGYSGIGLYLGYYDLSYNNFSGGIPGIWGENTDGIYLSHNHFSGGTDNLLNYFSGIAVANEADISYNNLNFDMEPLVDKINRIGTSHGFILTYAPQLEIPIHYNEGKLSVTAGGTLNNNTYNWYKDGVLDTTIKGDSTYIPTKTGTYYVIVQNTIATKLKLKSEPVDIQTLPISVLNFKCTQHYSTVLLQWQTSEEGSTIGFNIQRSIDAIHYTTIGKVEANDYSSNALKNYKYSDETTSLINAEKFFYRLEIVDQNQQNQLSKVISIVLQKEDIICTIYPNPAIGYINLKFQQSLPKNIHIKIFDFNGKKVKEKELSREVNQRISIAELNAGLYNVVFYDEHRIIYKVSLLIK